MKKLIMCSTLLAVFLIGGAAFAATTSATVNPSTTIDAICKSLGYALPTSTPTPSPTPPPAPSPTPPPPVSGIVLTNVYTTGYANYDNTPRGSNQTDLGGHTGTTGGNGTYANPTTLAVGGSIINGKEVDDFPYGTVFYVPNLRKYFIAKDFCGDGSSPQTQPCHSLAQAPTGATLWIDLYVGGGSANENNCEDAITALHTVILNPPANLAVIQGDVCSVSGVAQQQFGNAIVTI